MTYRSTPAFAIGGVKAEFRCLICNAETATHHFLEPRGICEQHCDDHEYDNELGWLSCVHCGAEAPDDYYHYDDDIGLGGFSSGYVAGEPIGVPASAMNGNASARSASPKARAAWDTWVAFCERNGMP